MCKGFPKSKKLRLFVGWMVSFAYAQSLAAHVIRRANPASQDSIPYRRNKKLVSIFGEPELFWLPSSPNILFEIFTGQRLAQIREQLRDLKRILKMEPSYEVMKVKGGEVIKF